MVCLDPSLALKPIISRAKSVIFTSGSMSQIRDYSKILNIETSDEYCCDITVRNDYPLRRNTLSPLIVTKGPDTSITNSSSEIENQGNVRNIGNLIVSLSQTVPDGIIVYFSSYFQMESMLTQWNEMKKM